MRYYIVPILVIGGVLAVIFFLLISVVEGAREKRAKWEAFKVENNCVLVGQKDGQTQTGFGVGTSVNSKGHASTTVTPIVTTTPAQSAWSCEDGITYWKNN